MKTRCDNPNSTNYAYWGGRGIGYSPKWVNFEEFYEDMKEGYADNLSLDRIDNNKGYSKENCRWATREQQQNNARNNHIFDFNDMKKTLSEWARYLNIKRSTLSQRYFVYKWGIEKCLTYKRGGDNLAN